ncbi:MAG: hypothetical protein QGG36_25345 [Pirellulaceae bacterium]|nr:hypothetical protein [Pirellulaceae bacterium]
MPYSVWMFPRRGNSGGSTYSWLYNLTMYLTARLLAVALIANPMIGPVDARHHLPDKQ